MFDFSEVEYKVEGISDHTPLLVNFRHCPKPIVPFKYCDMWSKDP